MTQKPSRLDHFPNSAISYIARLAEKYQAVNLAQGVPDFDPPAELLAAATRAIQGGFNQYSQTWGLPSLREALAQKHTLFSGLEIDPDQHVTITVGGTEALLAALTTVTNPGDMILFFSPYYEAYLVDSLLLSTQTRIVPLYPPEFRFDPDELKAAFHAGGRVLVLCNPSNPTGKVFSREELEIIANLAQTYDAFVIADEIYEHIVYPPHQHIYLASLPGMFERTISCSSVSKTYAVTGWRVGWAIAAPALSTGLRKVHDFLSVCAPTPLQEAAATALKLPPSYYQQMIIDYAYRRDIFLKLLQEAGLSYLEPQGAYYVLVDITSFDFEDDYRFCEWLIKEIGVAAIPGSYFFHEPIHRYIRMNFAKHENTLLRAGERLQNIRSKI